VGTSPDVSGEIREALGGVEGGDKIVADLEALRQTYPKVRDYLGGFTLGESHVRRIGALQHLLFALERTSDALDEVRMHLYDWEWLFFQCDKGHPKVGLPLFQRDVEIVRVIVQDRLESLRTIRVDGNKLIDRPPSTKRRRRPPNQGRFTLACLVAQAFYRNGVPPTCWSGSNRQKDFDSPYLRVLGAFVREFEGTELKDLKTTARAAANMVNEMREQSTHPDKVFHFFFDPKGWGWIVLESRAKHPKFPPTSGPRSQRGGRGQRPEN
jgi:hypothetical protein